MVLARKTGVRSVLLGINYDRAWRVPSWDRFYLPVAESTVRVSFETRTAGELRDNDAIARMESDLIRLNPDPLAQAGRFENTGQGAV